MPIGEDQSTRGKPCSSDTFSHHEFNIDRPGMDPGLCCEKLITNRLSQGTPTLLAAVPEIVKQQQQQLHHRLLAQERVPS